MPGGIFRITRWQKNSQISLSRVLQLLSLPIVIRDRDWALPRSNGDQYICKFNKKCHSQTTISMEWRYLVLGNVFSGLCWQGNPSLRHRLLKPSYLAGTTICISLYISFYYYMILYILYTLAYICSIYYILYMYKFYQRDE